MQIAIISFSDVLIYCFLKMYINVGKNSVNGYVDREQVEKSQ